jgi:GTP-binding protein HflX
MRQKLATCHDTLYERNEAPIVTVLNKMDTVDEADLEDKQAALSALAPDPVAVSGLTGENVGTLLSRIEAELPDWERERLVLPMTDDTMSVVSWVHDHGNVESEEYDDDQVLLEFEARPAVVQQARSKAGDLSAAGARVDGGT